MKIFLVALLFCMCGCQDLRIEVVDGKSILKTGNFYFSRRPDTDGAKIKWWSSYDISEMKEVIITTREK